jgi:hypothetical protein
VGTPNNAPVYVKYNTTYGNEQDTHQAYLGLGECIIESASLTSFTNNLCATSAANDPAGKPVYALSVTSADATDTMTTNWAAEQGGNSTFKYNSGSFVYGGNTLGTSPSFTSTTIPTAPSCSGTTNVPDCMTTLISNFTPRNTSAKAYGYQTVTVSNITDSLFPQWLCNVNLPSGLVTTGCVQLHLTAAVS